MWSPATRSVYLNGPTHTGSLPNFSPSLRSWAGDMIIPARSASSETSGAEGAFRCSRTVAGSTTSTDSTDASSPERLEVFSSRWRSSEVLTASASKGVPSLNFTPSRSGIVSVLRSSETRGIDAASCGTTSSFGPTS